MCAYVTAVIETIKQLTLVGFVICRIMDSLDTKQRDIKPEPVDLPAGNSFPAADDATDDYTAADGDDDEEASFHLVSLSA